MDEKEIELDLLLEGIRRRHGHDFRDYARASLRRRVASLLAKLGLDNVSEVIPRLLRDNAAIMSASLKEQFSFANHNLVTDGVSGEMNGGAAP